MNPVSVTDAGRAAVLMRPLLLLLVGISALGPIVMNGVLPANGQIVEHLQTSFGAVQMVLTVFLFSSLIGQIVLGNAADQYGRRPVMIFSLFVFGVGGVMCAMANSIEWLLVARFVQGFGAASCSFLPRTIVRDIYDRDKAASMIGYMTMAMMVAPMFGPALGGWVTDNLSWRWMYAGLGGAGFLFCFLSWRYQPETLLAGDPAIKRLSLLSAAAVLLKQRAFVANSMMMAGAIGGYYSFLAGAPYVMMKSRGYSPSEYGLWFMMVAIGYITGNLIAGRLSSTLGTRRMVRLAMLPACVAVVLFWVFSGWIHPLGLFIPMMLFALSNGMAIPNMLSAAMSVRTDLMSSASGLAGAIQLAFGVLITFILGYVQHLSDYWLFIVMTVSMCVALLGLLIDSSETSSSGASS